MGTSWPDFCENCKSRFSAIARSVYLGREHWIGKYRDKVASLKSQLAHLETEKRDCELVAESLRQQLNEARRITHDLEQQLATRNKRVHLPEDPPVPGQHYGASLMALSVNLAREVGFRKTTRAMQIFFDWLGVERDIPCYQAVRSWMQRIGLDRMRHAPLKSDRIWIVDVSTQIGTDKFLAVLSIEQSKLPPLGTALRLADMDVLAVHPAKKWNREKVVKLYQRLAQKYGYPKAVITDGASELRYPIESLEKDGIKPRAIRDLKHFLANRFEQLLQSDPRYHAFAKDLNQTRPSMQQTELGHLAPPKMKLKARFMNMRPLLKWAALAIWQSENPNSDGRKGVSQERLQTKLGWLFQYRKDIERWTNFQEVISACLLIMNTQGLYRGVTDKLHRQLQVLAAYPESTSLVDRIIDFVGSQEKKLLPGERLPISSEILESSFGAYKQLEQQHARGGYTQLMLVFPVLMKPTNTEEIRGSFQRVKIKDIKAWVDRYLPKTLDGRRMAAYREYRDAMNDQSTSRATTLAA